MRDPFKIIIAGGGESPTQDQMQQQIQISPPEPAQPVNSTDVIVALIGLASAVVVAFLGYLAVRHRRS